MSEFDAIKQLELILRYWRQGQHIDVRGAMIDYLHRSGGSLFELLKANYNIYEAIFLSGSVEDQENLLRSVIHSQRQCQDLFDQCEKAYPVVAERLHSIYGESPRVTKQDAFEVLREKDKSGILWQLSDVHFGRFNVSFPDPLELASLFAHAVGLHPEVKPDYVLVSGDLTSTAAADEFVQFKAFCSRLSEELWGTICPQRILVVPGNHDTAWKDDGTSDHLSRFAEMLGDTACCIIPFGEASSTYTGPNVHVSRFAASSASPPFALVRLDDLNIEVILLVSAFYSGSVPEDLRMVLSKKVSDSDLRGEIIEHVRKDSGEITIEYLASISKALSTASAPRIGLIHHHLEQYAYECALSRYGFALLKTLFSKGVAVVLHGHLHMFEDAESIRGKIPGLAFSIPCSTIASYTWRRSPGFLVHVLSRNAEDCQLKSLTWELSAGGLFDADLLRPAYEAQLSGGNLGGRRVM